MFLHQKGRERKSNLQLKLLIMADAECGDLLHHKPFDGPASDAAALVDPLGYSSVFFFLQLFFIFTDVHEKINMNIRSGSTLISSSQ